MDGELSSHAWLMILINGLRLEYTTFAQAHHLPMSHVSFWCCSSHLKYFTSLYLYQGLYQCNIAKIRFKLRDGVWIELIQHWHWLPPHLKVDQINATNAIDPGHIYNKYLADKLCCLIISFCALIFRL